MYDYWHGDEILKQLQKYDPNARVVQVADSSGGEGGGGSGVGWKFEFDQSKLPAMGPAGYNVDWAPANRELRNPNLVYNDPIYGPLTPRQNIAKQKDPWWVTAAPLAVAGLATAGAAIPALAAGGVAGGTAGVTGGAAGLAAGNIASGIGNTWWSQILSKAPQLARMATPPTATPWTPPAPAAPAVPNQFNAANFNNTGSMAKPGSNDSALVATQFAADPYGASQQ
jgi:hypothetical protein